MQSSNLPVPHTLAEFIWLLVVGFLTWAGTFFIPRFKRKQSEAETAKLQAETRQIDLQSTIHAGDMMIDLMKLSAQSALDTERLRKEKEFWQAKAETESEARKAAETAREIAEQQLDELIRIGKP